MNEQPVYFTIGGKPVMFKADYIKAIRCAGGESEGKAIIDTAVDGVGCGFNFHIVDQSPAEAIEIFRRATETPHD